MAQEIFYLIANFDFKIIVQIERAHPAATVTASLELNRSKANVIVMRLDCRLVCRGTEILSLLHK